MKRIKSAIAGAVLLGSVAGVLGGCSYAGVAASGNNVVIAKNDLLLAGLLREVFVCQLTPQGLTNCSSLDAP